MPSNQKSFGPVLAMIVMLSLLFAGFVYAVNTTKKDAAVATSPANPN